VDTGLPGILGAIALLRVVMALELNIANVFMMIGQGRRNTALEAMWHIDTATGGHVEVIMSHPGLGRQQTEKVKPLYRQQDT